MVLLVISLLHRKGDVERTWGQIPEWVASIARWEEWCFLGFISRP